MSELLARARSNGRLAFEAACASQPGRDPRQLRRDRRRGTLTELLDISLNFRRTLTDSAKRGKTIRASRYQD